MRISRSAHIVVVLALIAGAAVAAEQPAAPAGATLRLPAIISDHMLLQRDIAASVWGWAAPGATVSIGLGAQRTSAVAAADGRWQAWLEPMPAGGPFDLVIRADREIVVRDVLVGDVWVG